MEVRGTKSGFHGTKQHRRELRKNPSVAEKIFWSKVANRQFQNLKFKRQHGIGNYIADFYCSEKKLIIEIDGDTHALQIGYDKQRTKYLRSLGYRVIRYNNLDILNDINGVFEDFTIKLRSL